MSETKDAPFTYITSARLATWDACADGALWFAEHYPQGGEYAAVSQALVAFDRADWAGWLAEQSGLV